MNAEICYLNVPKFKVSIKRLINNSNLHLLSTSKRTTLLKSGKGTNFTNFTERTDKIATTDLIGTLEMMATSSLLQCPIELFRTNNIKSESFTSYMVIGKKSFSDQVKPVRLLFHAAAENGDFVHYDLLMPAEEFACASVKIDNLLPNVAELWHELNVALADGNEVSLLSLIELSDIPSITPPTLIELNGSEISDFFAKSQEHDYASSKDDNTRVNIQSHEGKKVKIKSRSMAESNLSSKLILERLPYTLTRPSQVNTHKIYQF